MTTYQTSMQGIGKPETQTELLAEFTGLNSKKDTLIDVEKFEAQQAARPLEGQIELIQSGKS